jgi:hypothetical protein
MNCLPFRSTWVFSEVRVIRSLVLCVCFVDRCLPFCPFSFGHCVACPSSIYAFWLPLWYLQTLLLTYNIYQSNIFVIVKVYLSGSCMLLNKSYQRYQRGNQKLYIEGQWMQLLPKDKWHKKHTIADQILHIKRKNI